MDAFRVAGDVWADSDCHKIRRRGFYALGAPCRLSEITAHPVPMVGSPHVYLRGQFTDRMMVNQRKAIEWELSREAGVDSVYRALRAAVSTTASVERDADALATLVTPVSVDSARSAALPVALSGEWALKEVECAREFNFELGEDLIAAVERLEQAVQNVMGVRKSAILVFDEHSGVYACLNDLKLPGGRMRELTRIADWFLQDLLGSQGDLLHSYLLLPEGLVGMVVVAEKETSEPFTPQDQMLLDIVAPYLAIKVRRFNNLKQSLVVPYIQGMVLEVAGALVSAVDQDSIMTAVLDAFATRMGFDACQYVGFNADCGTGEVLYELRNSQAKPGQKFARVQSYSHAGLEGKRRTIEDYANLVGLVSSMARNRFYLHLTNARLGDRPLSDIFGVPDAQSALLLPVTDAATGEIRGTFNLFHTTSAPISEESREIAKEVAYLTSRALGRSLVLEKALAMASSDELTGLINRRGFYQRFEGEIERSRRQKTPLCVALVDVDHFKRFNDTYGHLSGDLVLKALADLFTQNMRKSDVVCRFGGEEFAILLPDTSLKASADLMERLRQRVEAMQLRGFNGERLSVTISVGLTEVNTQVRPDACRSEISDALATADEYLYAAKHQGRNQVMYEASSEVDDPVRVDAPLAPEQSQAS